MYALWKSSKLPAAQGRISLRLSAHEPPKSPVSENEKEEVASIGPRPRGWWDYVPETNPPMTEPQQSRASTWHIVDDGGFVQNMRFLMFSKKVTRSPSGRHKREKSNASQASQQQLTNVNSVHFQDNVEKSYFDVSRAASPAQSHTGSVGKLMDRMRHFREMLRNEVRPIPPYVARVICAYKTMSAAGPYCIHYFDKRHCHHPWTCGRLRRPTNFSSVLHWCRLYVLLLLY